MKYIFFVLYLVHFYVTYGQVPAFRVIAPQTICNDELGSDEDAATDAVSISFQTFGNEKFSYQFRIFFKIMDNQKLSQRETLIVWKCIRALENRLNSLERLNITANNMFLINDTELFSGVSYIFHLVGITDSGQKTKENTFVINYVNGMLQNANTVDHMNLLLIGTSQTIGALSYALFAKVTFCRPNYYYKMRWKISNVGEENQALTQQISSIFYISPNTLTANATMTIEAEVIDMNSTKVIAQDFLELYVLQKGFQFYLFPSNARIGINISLSVQLYLNDYDNNIGKAEIYWDYYKDNAPAGSEVLANLSLYNTKCTVIFKIPGRYEIIVTIKLNGVQHTSTTYVYVEENIPFSYDYDFVPNMNPAQNEEFTFSILVIDLYPKCIAGWRSVDETNFEYITEKELGSSNFGQVLITDRQEKYLLELTDLDNIFYDRQLNLHIPMKDKTKNWGGLKGAAKYKFRLDVICPDVFGHFEFVVETNAAPEILPFTIQPTMGYALKTIFQITINAPVKDLVSDSPISYELCGLFDNYQICFGKYTDYRTWEILLPLTKRETILYLTVCSMRGACSTINGNAVSVEMSEITESEFQLQMEKINGAFWRMDFSEGLRDIALVYITYKNSNSKFLSAFFKFGKMILEKEIDKMLERSSDSTFYYYENLLEFILQTKLNLDIFEIDDIVYRENLLNIIENIQFEHIDEDTSDLLNSKYRTYPMKQPLNKLYIEISLLLAEDILESSDSTSRDKQQIVENQIIEIIEKLCYSDFNLNEKFETSTISLWILKYSGQNLWKKNFRVLNSFKGKNTTLNIKFRNIDNVIRSQSYCISIIQYARDYFTNDQTPLTYVQLYDLASNRDTKLGRIVHNSNKIELEFSKLASEKSVCLSRNENKWSTEFCNIKYESFSNVICNCVHFGFYRIGPKPELASGEINATAPYNVENDDIDAMNADTIATTAIAVYENFTGTKSVEHTVNQATNTSVQKAGGATYLMLLSLLPLIAIALAFFIYYRRYPRKNKNVLINLYEPLQPRTRKSEIVYPHVYDAHLLG